LGKDVTSSYCHCAQARVKKGQQTVRRALATAVIVAGIAASLNGQTKAAVAAATPSAVANDRVDMELMTWVEIKDAMAHGKTTALIYNGGTETRGPQCVTGGHTFVARAKAVAIARQLGNALAAPVLPFSPNNATPDLPGTIGITADTFKEINTEVAEQLIRNGFKNIVLMGDHGGGQKELGEVAAELDAKYAGQGIRVIFCSDAYKKSNDDFDAWLASKGYSPGGHASVNDTSEMMYLQPAPDAWVRSDMLSQAVGTPRAHTNPPTPPDPDHPSNGVSGDGRRSSAELGKYGYELHVNEAVAQIQQLLGETRQ
jgi:creatinine amidohydrolase